MRKLHLSESLYVFVYSHAVSVLLYQVPLGQFRYCLDTFFCHYVCFGKIITLVYKLSQVILVNLIFTRFSKFNKQNMTAIVHYMLYFPFGKGLGLVREMQVVLKELIEVYFRNPFTKKLSQVVL